LGRPRVVLQNFFLCAGRDGMPRAGLVGGAAGSESPLGRKRGEVEYYSCVLQMALASVRREAEQLPEGGAREAYERALRAERRRGAARARASRTAVAAAAKKKKVVPTARSAAGAADAAGAGGLLAHQLATSSLAPGEQREEEEQQQQQQQQQQGQQGQQQQEEEEEEGGEEGGSVGGRRDEEMSGTLLASGDVDGDLEALANPNDERQSVQELGQWFTQQRAVDELMDVLM